MPPVPWPTVRLKQVAVVTSIVTVAELAMVTLSAAVGATPPTHVPGALQFPPLAVEVILAAVTVRAESATNAMVTAAHEERLRGRGRGLIPIIIGDPNYTDNPIKIIK